MISARLIARVGRAARSAALHGALFGSLASMATSLSAQGPVYRERWSYLHLEHRRAEVLHELAGRSEEQAAEVASILSRPARGVPMRPVAEALAHLRSVPCDDAFLLRAMVGAFVLPEVVDVDATVESCRQANFSLFLPNVVEAPGPIRFDVRVHDAAGDLVFEQRVERDTGVRDLRLAQAKAIVPTGLLADGSYRVEVRTEIDGQPPRENDPVLRWRFHVLQGYQRRAESALAAASSRREQLEPLPAALLDGFATRVARAYAGDAFDVRSDAVHELALLERCLDNLDAERAPLHGLGRELATALPGGDGIVQPVRLRLADGDGPHPAVVFVSGSPSYGTQEARPTAPATRSGDWTAHALGDFGRDEGWHVVCIDSPGGGRAFAKALGASLEALPKLLDTGGQRPLLVCEREAAGVVALHLGRLRDSVAGVVMVGAGAMPGSVLEQVGDLPVRVVALHGYAGSDALARMLEHLPSNEQLADRVDVDWLHRRPEPWPLGIARSTAEITAFARAVFSSR